MVLVHNSGWGKRSTTSSRLAKLEGNCLGRPVNVFQNGIWSPRPADCLKKERKITSVFLLIKKLIDWIEQDGLYVVYL